MSIQDILMYDETLFRETIVFNPDYIPSNFNYRKNEMDEMARAIRPALNGNKPDNLVILGPPATGKTSSIKIVFKEVEKFSENMICSYVNCQLNTRKLGLFSQIHKDVCGYVPPRTGVPFMQVYDNIMKELEKKNKSLIVALDDANHLLNKGEMQEVLYTLLRSHEKFPSIYVGVFIILSEPEFKVKLDKSVNTVFRPKQINFKPYNYEETFNILNDRAKIGYFPGVISDEIIEEIADFTVDEGDLRAGIDLLRQVGNIAESEASKEVSSEHLYEAIDKHKSYVHKMSIASLSKEELDVLEIIVNKILKLKTNDILTVSSLSNIVEKELNLSYTKCTRIVNKLEFLRLIDTQLSGKGKRGKVKYIYLRFRTEDFEELKYI